MRRLRLLISAYACEPGEGSEPGVGWNIVREAARRHDVWVITRANNRQIIEDELARNPLPNLRVAYFDLPRWMRWWKRGKFGVQLYYYLWQLGIYGLSRRLHREHAFDLTQHVTFVRYWSPSMLALLPVPFVWGPVGGGESAPRALWRYCGPRGMLVEQLRCVARWLGERDPLVRVTARRSTLALAVTDETSARLRALGVRRVVTFSAMGLSHSEYAFLQGLPAVPDAPLRFLSMGRMLHWKGFHWGLRAFAAAGISDAEYWLVGTGPALPALKRLASELGIADRVRVWGPLPRGEALKKLAQSHALVHPSLHDSGGCVCLEAMAAGRPVICLDLGGPAAMVTQQTGFKVVARDPDQIVCHLARAMLSLAESRELRLRMGEAARQRAASTYLWERKGEWLSGIYSRMVTGVSHLDGASSEDLMAVEPQAQRPSGAPSV